MNEDVELWPEPRVTPNSMLLSGYLMGALVAGPERGVMYRAVSIEPQEGTQVVERTETGNRYLVTVQQISGDE